MRRPPRFQWILLDNEPDYPDVATWAKVAAHRIVRRTWLSVLLVLDHPPLYRDYRRRFGVSMHTFRRDERKTRVTLWYFDAALRGKCRTCFYIEKSIP